jgi:hypothetical protein
VRGSFRCVHGGDRLANFPSIGGIAPWLVGGYRGS